MIQKIAVPLEMDKGTESPVGGHFGRAPYFGIVKISNLGNIESIKVVPNTSDHMGGVGNPVENLVKIGINTIISQGMGMRAIRWFNDEGVQVLQCPFGTLNEIISLYLEGSLFDLTRGCDHGHDHR